MISGGFTILIAAMLAVVSCTAKDVWGAPVVDVAELPRGVVVAEEPLVVGGELQYIVWFSKISEDVLGSKRVVGGTLQQPIPQVVGKEGLPIDELQLPSWKLYASQQEYLRLDVLPRNICVDNGYITYSVMGSIYLSGKEGAQIVPWVLEHEVLSYRNMYESIVSIEYKYGKHLAVTFEIDDNVKLKERSRAKWGRRPGMNTVMMVGTGKPPVDPSVPLPGNTKDERKWVDLGQCRLSRAAWFGEGLLITSGALPSRDGNKVFLSQVNANGDVVKTATLYGKGYFEAVAASQSLEYIAVRMADKILCVNSGNDKTVVLEGAERVLGLSCAGEAIIVRRDKGDRRSVVVIDKDGTELRKLLPRGGGTSTCIRDGRVIFVDEGRIVSIRSGVNFSKSEQ